MWPHQGPWFLNSSALWVSSSSAEAAPRILPETGPGAGCGASTDSREERTLRPVTLRCLLSTSGQWGWGSRQSAAVEMLGRWQTRMRWVSNRPGPRSGGAQVRPVKEQKGRRVWSAGGRWAVERRSLLRLTNLGAGMCQQSEAELVQEGLNLRQAVTEDSDKVGKSHREAPILVQPWEKQRISG